MADNVVEDENPPGEAPTSEPTAFDRLVEEAKKIEAGTAKRGRRTELSDEKIDQLMRLKDQGVTVTKICREFHISPGRLRQMWGEGGVAATPPKRAVRMTKHFIAVEPPEPVAAKLSSVVRRRIAGKTARPKAKGKGRKKADPERGDPESDCEESESTDSDDACPEVPPDVEMISERFLEGLSAFRAGVDDETDVENLKGDLKELRRLGEMPALKFTKLMREISAPRHEPLRAETIEPAGGGSSAMPKASPGLENLFRQLS